MCFIDLYCNYIVDIKKLPFPTVFRPDVFLIQHQCLETSKNFFQILQFPILTRYSWSHSSREPQVQILAKEGKEETLGKAVKDSQTAEMLDLIRIE